MTRQELPPVVYVPARPVPDGEMEVELQLMTDGRRGLFCYSALDRLRDMYGDQGWLVLTVEGLQALYDESARPYDLIFVDKAPNVVGDQPPEGSQ